MVNPRVFLDFTVDGTGIGRVVFELFADTAPKTAENFRALCTGEKGLSRLSEQPLYYKNSIIHRSIPGFMIQGGDFTKRNGTGGESIYGGTFSDEDLARPIDSEGLLCMANKGPNTNGSQFFLTLRECPHLNGKHVVFGRVIRGYDVVQRIAEIPTDAKDRPTAPVTIINCGELVLKSKIQSSVPEPKLASPVSASESDRSEGERRRRKMKRRRRHDASNDDRDSAVASQDDWERDRQHRKKSKHKSRTKSKHQKEKEQSLSTVPSAPVPPEQETDEQYDARLEREEKERIEEAKRRELERLRRMLEEKEVNESSNGVRFKGRGRMKYVDPELRGHRDL